MIQAITTLLLISITATIGAQIPARGIATPKAEIDDAFMAFLHGVIVSDAPLGVTGPELQVAFPEFLPQKPTPFLDIVYLSRSRLASEVPARVTLEFSVPFEHEVPLDILGYRPVVLRGSRVIGVDEVVRTENDVPANIRIPARLTNPIVLHLAVGFMEVDFAEWLDRVAGRFIEDVDVHLIAVVRYDGRWFALIGGLSPGRRIMIGVFDMQTSRFRVRPPRDLTRFAQELVAYRW